MGHACEERIQDTEETEYTRLAGAGPGEEPRKEEKQEYVMNRLDIASMSVCMTRIFSSLDLFGWGCCEVYL